jgi:hypothetical protein
MAENSKHTKRKKSNATKLNYCMTRASDGYLHRVTQQIQKIPKHDDIETEWENIKSITNTAANESLGNAQHFQERKKLKIWDEEIKQIIHSKNLAYMKYVP